MDFLSSLPQPTKSLENLALQIVKDHLEQIKYWATESHPHLMHSLSIEESLTLNQLVIQKVNVLKNILNEERSSQ